VEGCSFIGLDSNAENKGLFSLKKRLLGNDARFSGKLRGYLLLSNVCGFRANPLR
jgi:hypothetical protein